MKSNQQGAPFYWWTWKEGFTSNQTDYVINLGKNKWQAADTIGSENFKQPIKQIRQSDIVWINNQEIIDLIWPYMETANKQAGFNYEITAVENIQLTKYSKKGFYSWHMDGMGTHPTVYNMPHNKFLHGKTRKLSMTVLLNSDFEGGEFQIHTTAPTDKTEKLDMSSGSVVVFPSFLLHRVTPVTKGTRYSLVAWFVGPPFR